MSTVVVLATPPRDGLVLPELAGDALAPASATTLYRGMLLDVTRAAARSGGDLLVNYRAPDGDEDAAEREVRDAIAPLADVEDPRMEVQVGSTLSARVGNTVTHLLEREDAPGVYVLRPEAPLLGRTDVDSAAMKLRGHDAVIAPAGTEVALAGFQEPLDFTDALEPPALTALADRVADADLRVDFTPPTTLVDSRAALLDLVAAVQARRRADRTVPEYTAAAIADLGLEVVRGEDGPELAGLDDTRDA